MNDMLIFVLSAVLIILIGVVVRRKNSTKTNAKILSRGKFIGIFILIAIACLFAEKIKFSPILQTSSSTASPVPDSELKAMSLSPKILSKASASPSIVPTVNKKKALLISISGPAQLYESNDSIVRKHHEGPPLQVSGTVYSIDQDIFNNIIVILHSGNQFSGVHASLNGKYKNMTVSLKEGQEIILLCKSGAVIVGSLILRHCAPA